MTKHGTFMEWSETGYLTLQGTYFVGKLNGELNSFYSNQKPKRQDVYYLDTLKSGHCFDSLGVEIAHFPYQVKPEFKGGQSAMFRFLASTVKYPRDAMQEGSAGTAYVSFVVSKDGKIKNALRKFTPLCPLYGRSRLGSGVPKTVSFSKTQRTARALFLRQFLGFTAQKY